MCAPPSKRVIYIYIYIYIYTACVHPPPRESGHSRVCMWVCMPTCVHPSLGSWAGSVDVHRAADSAALAADSAVAGTLRAAADSAVAGVLRGGS